MNMLLVIALTVIVLLLAQAFRSKPPAPSSTDPAVTQAFRRLFFRQWLMAVPTAIFLVWALKSPSSGGALHGLMLPLAFVVLIFVGVFTYRNWRCPKCGAYLGRNPLYTGQCPSCGTALREPRGS
ncbi:hypothetical protein PY254_17860 [Rhodanobacter sp. AS-Z3]|uniref:hypothetical protein n=1 Tax=Rhodanobacter sp. AS-Z3 TaxID=3031330 RepID=UPI00247B11DE|nr:hypothetical protein [Rhodanobacter sp. AS-Z3]WEN15069.1 hypothetical protein PY254_17860 [Rhodanobacter sp. AS-Z3]